MLRATAGTTEDAKTKAKKQSIGATARTDDAKKQQAKDKMRSLEYDKRDALWLLEQYRDWAGPPRNPNARCDACGARGKVHLDLMI
jgi:hypothetical protein